MERLIVIMGYQDYEGGGDEVRAVFYDSKDKLLADMEADYNRIVEVLVANPLKPLNLSDYQHPLQTRLNRSTKNLKSQEQFLADRNEFSRVHEIHQNVKKTWAFEHLVSYEAYAAFKNPSNSNTTHSFDVYTVDEFFNDPERIVVL